MPATYKQAPEALEDQVNVVFAKHYSDVLDAGFTVDAVFCHAARDKEGEPTGPAIKVGGAPALIKASLMSANLVVRGVSEIELQIDGDRWEGLSKAQQNAVIDHGLAHFELVEPSAPDGDLKLKKRQPDRSFRWWDDVAKRHGDASIERTEAKELTGAVAKIYFQTEFAFGDTPSNGHDTVAVDETTDYDSMTVPDLRRLAKHRDVELPRRAPREAILEALRASQH